MPIGEMAHASKSRRKAAGRAMRDEVPLAAHAEFTPAADRDPIAILQRQAESRAPDLVPVRYGRMMVSPFTFYRGAAAVMAADLAGTPSPGLRSQLCGDAHLANFGAYASPERRLVFDINDFDETLPGPFEWDVKRLAASLVIAAHDNGFDRRCGGHRSTGDGVGIVLLDLDRQSDAACGCGRRPGQHGQLQTPCCLAVRHLGEAGNDRLRRDAGRHHGGLGAAYRRHLDHGHEHGLGVVFAHVPDRALRHGHRRHVGRLTLASSSAMDGEHSVSPIHLPRLCEDQPRLGVG